jgi:hypothetical protein
MRALGSFALTACLLSATPGFAASPKLDEARKLIDDLEMESALKALDAADKSEGNDRATVLEIWLLQGIAFGTASKEAKTRDSFRKLLMLAPESTLPPDLPPRVKTPFFEAKEWAGTNGPTTAVATADFTGGVVKVVRVSMQKDLLRLGRTARFHINTGAGEQTVDVPFTQYKAEAPVDKPHVLWWAEVLSDRKAVLFTLGSAAAPREDGEAVVASTEPIPSVQKEAPVSGGWRRPTGFVLLGAGAVAAGVGAILGAQSSAARNRITNAERDAEGRVTSITQAEAGPLEASANTQATVANVLFGVGGALGAAGLVLVIIGPSHEPTVALSPAPSGLVVHGQF